jgi:hypothetical protein
MAKWLAAPDHTGAWWLLPPNRETGYRIEDNAEPVFSTEDHDHGKSLAHWCLERLNYDDTMASWVMHTWDSADPPPELAAMTDTDTCTHCDDPLIRDKWGRWEHEFPQDDLNHLAYPRNPYNRKAE